MPSLCWPLDFGPKPVMTRPRPGQRKAAAPVLAGAPASAVACGPEVARRAVDDGSGLARFCGTTVPGARGGAGGFGAATMVGACLAATSLPGMTIRSPIFTRVWGGILFAAAISVSGL